MASKQNTVDFILDQMSDAGRVSARKMFGEYAIYCQAKVVALVCDDRLFVKPTDAGKAFIGDFQEGLPYPGAKPCLVVSGDLWEDRDWLSRLIKLTANALPLPQPKGSKAKLGKKKAKKKATKKKATKKKATKKVARRATRRAPKG